MAIRQTGAACKRASISRGSFISLSERRIVFSLSFAGMKDPNQAPGTLGMFQKVMLKKRRMG
jgi:hypothetical protein